MNRGESDKYTEGEVSREGDKEGGREGGQLGT